MKIKQGDTVKVLYGKDSGKTGKVLRVSNKNQKVLVEGVNEYRKHVKGDGQGRASEVVTITKAMPVSKVMLIDPKSGKPTRVKYEIKDGVKSRVAVKSGAAIDTAVEKTAKKVDEKKPVKTESKSSKDSK